VIIVYKRLLSVYTYLERNRNFIFWSGHVLSWKHLRHRYFSFAFTFCCFKFFGLAVKAHIRFATLTPYSRIPAPYSRLPTPNSLLPAHLHFLRVSFGFPSGHVREFSKAPRRIANMSRTRHEGDTNKVRRRLRECQITID
jgi:hypothetical protein